MDPAPTSPSVIYIGQHGTSASGFATIAWLEATPDDWPHVTRGWDETRAHVTHRHRIPVDTEILRSVEPESSTANHRRQRALSNALHTISNQNIRIGSVLHPHHARQTTGPSKTHSTPHSSNKSTPDSKTTASSESSSPQQNSPHPRNSALHRILETATPPHTSAGTQMANIIAWAAHQHLTHHDQPNFCWDLYQDLRHIDIYGEPLAIDTETHWAEVEYASTTTESTR